MSKKRRPREIKPTPEEIARIDAMIEATRKLTPMQRLARLGEMNRFLWKHMTPEARKRFIAERDRRIFAAWQGKTDKPERP